MRIVKQENTTGFLLQAWYEKDNVMNLHIGESPNAGTKCVGVPAFVLASGCVRSLRQTQYPVL